jgi:hypothetical protein
MSANLCEQKKKKKKEEKNDAFYMKIKKQSY